MERIDEIPYGQEKKPQYSSSYGLAMARDVAVKKFPPLFCLIFLKQKW